MSSVVSIWLTDLTSLVMVKKNESNISIPSQNIKTPEVQEVSFTMVVQIQKSSKNKNKTNKLGKK